MEPSNMPRSAASESNVSSTLGATDMLTFLPIPLATGQVFLCADGVARRIEDVEVVVTAGGQVHRLVLDARLGGWWMPAA